MRREYWWFRYGRFSSVSEQENRPHPGQVVASYRNRLGKDLPEVATELRIGDKMLSYYVEKRGKLDLIAHCRTLSVSLTIPPELLGLDSLHFQDDSLWWVNEGHPAFEKDMTCPSYPCPGQVVKHFRLQKYHNAPPDHKQEWTQAGFADALGLAKVSVKRMEQQSQHLNTLSRRRMVSFLLSIPPALLGLDSLVHPAPMIVSAKQRSVSLGTEDLARHWKQLEHLWTGYHGSHAQDTRKLAILRIYDLEQAIPFVATGQQGALLEVQADYHTYLAMSAWQQEADYTTAFSELGKVLDIARDTENQKLFALTLFNRSLIYQGQRDYRAAAADIEGAKRLADYAPLTLRCEILNTAGGITANAAQDTTDATRALRFSDQAGTLVRSEQINNEEPLMRLGVNPGWYHYKRSRAYLALAERFSLQKKTYLQDALSELVLAHQLTPEHLTRRLALCNLTEAQVYLQAGEYPQATTLALEVLPTFQAIRSRLNLLHLVTLYRDLQQSSYSSSPHVARLGWELSQAGLITL